MSDPCQLPRRQQRTLAASLGVGATLLACGYLLDRPVAPRVMLAVDQLANEAVYSTSAMVMLKQDNVAVVSFDKKPKPGFAV